MGGIKGRKHKGPMWHRDNPNYMYKRQESKWNYRIPKKCKYCEHLLSAQRSIKTGVCGSCAIRISNEKYRKIQNEQKF